METIGTATARLLPHGVLKLQQDKDTIVLTAQEATELYDLLLRHMREIERHTNRPGNLSQIKQKSP
jgi:hypothetical protein